MITMYKEYSFISVLIKKMLNVTMKVLETVIAMGIIVRTVIRVY